MWRRYAVFLYSFSVSFNALPVSSLCPFCAPGARRCVHNPSFLLHFRLHCHCCTPFSSPISRTLIVSTTRVHKLYRPARRGGHHHPNLVSPFLFCESRRLCLLTFTPFSPPFWRFQPRRLVIFNVPAVLASRAVSPCVLKTSQVLRPLVLSRLACFQGRGELPNLHHPSADFDSPYNYLV
jgi:hypothetical protein